MEHLRAFYNWFTGKDAMDKVIQGNNHFAFAIYVHMAGDRKYGDEVVFSPPALQIILAMLWIGASEKGVNQIEKALQLPPDRDTIIYGFKALYNKLLTTKFAIINMPIRIYTPYDVRLKRDFFVTCGRHFEVRLKPTNFLGDEGPARDGINEWVKKSTMYKVDQIIRRQRVDDCTQILIINGVNFECRMASPFLAQHVTTGIFNVSKTKTRKVHYLNQTASFRYGELDDFNAQILELPYMSPSLSLLIMLPNEVDGLREMEKKLPKATVLDLLYRMHEHRVQVTIVKFRQLYGYDGTDYLDHVGLDSLMSSDANGLVEVSFAHPPLSLTNLWQKTFFELTEEEGHTAKPGHDQKTGGPTIPTKVFRADHPFMFMVVDKVSGLIILIGRVTCKDRFDISMLRSKSGSELLIPRIRRGSWPYYRSYSADSDSDSDDGKKERKKRFYNEAPDEFSPLEDADFKIQSVSKPEVLTEEVESSSKQSIPDDKADGVPKPTDPAVQTESAPILCDATDNAVIA